MLSATELLRARPKIHEQSTSCWEKICSILPARRESDTSFSRERPIRIFPKKGEKCPQNRYFKEQLSLTALAGLPVFKWWRERDYNNGQKCWDDTNFPPPPPPPPESMLEYELLTVHNGHQLTPTHTRAHYSYPQCS